MILIFNEGEGDGIKSSLPFRIFYTLKWVTICRLTHDQDNKQSGASGNPKHGANSGNACVRFSTIINIGSASFKYDMRRLTEILIFPRAWYRRSLVRTSFKPNSNFWFVICINLICQFDLSILFVNFICINSILILFASTQFLSIQFVGASTVFGWTQNDLLSSGRKYGKLSSYEHEENINFCPSSCHGTGHRYLHKYIFLQNIFSVLARSMEQWICI